MTNSFSISYSPYSKTEHEDNSTFFASVLRKEASYKECGEMNKKMKKINSEIEGLDSKADKARIKKLTKDAHNLALKFFYSGCGRFDPETLSEYERGRTSEFDLGLMPRTIIEKQLAILPAFNSRMIAAVSNMTKTFVMPVLKYAAVPLLIGWAAKRAGVVRIPAPASIILKRVVTQSRLLVRRPRTLGVFTKAL